MLADIEMIVQDFDARRLATRRVVSGDWLPMATSAWNKGQRRSEFLVSGENNPAAKSGSIARSAPDRSTIRSVSYRSTELDQSEIVPAELSEYSAEVHGPSQCEPGVLRTPRRQHCREFRLGRQRSPDEAGARTGITMSARRAAPMQTARSRRHQRVKIRRVMFVTGYTQNKNRHWRRRQLNVLSACRCRALCRQTDHDPVHRIMISSVNWPTIPRKKIPVSSATTRPKARKETRKEPEKSHSSAGSSPSASRSGVPARICSAIRPEFWRIAASILAVMSGLALRKAFEFSRPWPSLWLS